MNIIQKIAVRRRLECGVSPLQMRRHLEANGVHTVVKVTRFSHLASVLISAQWRRKQPGKRQLRINREIAKV